MYVWYSLCKVFQRCWHSCTRLELELYELCRCPCTSYFPFELGYMSKESKTPSHHHQRQLCKFKAARVNLIYSGDCLISTGVNDMSSVANFGVHTSKINFHCARDEARLCVTNSALNTMFSGKHSIIIYHQHWFHIASITSNYNMKSIPTKHRVAIVILCLYIINLP
jgi:hypothetical protein